MLSSFGFFWHFHSMTLSVSDSVSFWWFQGWFKILFWHIQFPALSCLPYIGIVQLPDVRVRTCKKDVHWLNTGRRMSGCYEYICMRMDVSLNCHHVLNVTIYNWLRQSSTGTFCVLVDGNNSINKHVFWFLIHPILNCIKLDIGPFKEKGGFGLHAQNIDTCV